MTAVGGCYCRGQRTLSAHLACCPGGPPACQVLGSGMLQRGCRSLSLVPWTVTPCCFSSQAPVILSGRCGAYLKCECMTLGVRVKATEAGVPDGFLLNPAGEGLRSGWILWINSCLCCWCQQQGFDFYDHWTLSQDQELLGRDGIHLTTCGKNIFTNRLANLLRRNLN